MNEPNWDEAPEEADKFCVTNGLFYRGDSETLEVYISGDWDTSYLMAENRVFITRPTPTAWAGEGLPPVGAVCEVKGYPEGDFVEALVIAYNDDQSMFWYCTDGINGIHETSKAEFRPIRTPEQIAAQERELAIKDMAWLTSWPAAASTISICASLYDAGLRFTEPKR